MKFENVKCDNEDLISYHISPYNFKKPSYDEIYNLRIENKRDTHDNSFLGLWSSSFPNSYNRGESFCYRVKFKDSINIKYIKIRNFYEWCMLSNGDINYYINARIKFINEGVDVIIVLDHIGYNKYSLSEIITLNFDSILSFEKIDHKVKDLKYIVEVKDGLDGS